jgi:hypothetical protein
MTFHNTPLMFSAHNFSFTEFLFQPTNVPNPLLMNGGTRLLSYLVPANSATSC